LVVIGEAGEPWPGEGGRPTNDPASPPPLATATEEEGASQRHIVKAMPAVRKLAEELGVDLTTVTPGDPGGRISRQDVIAAAAASHVTQVPDAGVSGSDERVPLSSLRRTISAHMTRSWSEIPHVTTFDDVNASNLLALRSRLGSDEPVSLEALLVAAVLPALRDHPEFNATLEGEELVLRRRYNIGVAVDTAAGLMVPVIHRADEADLRQLNASITDLSERARARTLTAAELTGGTFTVSNIGALGGGHGTPIIPAGTTAIISFGRARDGAVVVKGSLVVAPVMPISLSYDHRVIDGGLGRRFIDDVIARIVDPGQLAPA